MTMLRSLWLATLLVLVALAGGALAPVADAAGASTSRAVRLAVPTTADATTTTAVSISFPVGTAAVDGRLLLNSSAAEVVGLAPVGGGVALAPQPIPGGYAFGAYGMKAKKGRPTIRIVISPLVAGKVDLNLVVDDVADASGQRQTLTVATASGSLHVNRGKADYGAQQGTLKPAPPHATGSTRDVVGDGALGRMDLDLVRAGWEYAALNSVSCSAADLSADANGDGCVDIVDLQAVYAAQGEQFATTRTVRTADTVAAARGTLSTVSGSQHTMAVTSTSVALNLTFVVNSTADTADTKPGDGLCADATGSCTLRAAVTESNWDYGPNAIQFNLSGPAPVAISVTGSEYSLQDRSGGLTIDGYSQPGSAANTATTGSNARPGIVLIGTGDAPRSNAFRVTSPSNVIRGVSVNTFWKGVVIDGTDARDNLVAGDFFGYSATGSPASYVGYAGVEVMNGATHNTIGTPALADENVIGRMEKALYDYGSGTNYNVMQNNLLCIAPDGVTAAPCLIGLDHDFGPSHNIFGGTGSNEKNVVGPTSRQAVEISHGWNPSGNPDPTGAWVLTDNSVVGNWLGFRGDGSYDPNFRSGQDNPGTGDNGNGVNVHDGCTNNVIDGNFVASKYDGIQMMAANSSGNIIRNNVVGVSPLGQAAPLTRDGIVARENLHSGVIVGNLVRNAGRYGIGLTNANVFNVLVSQNIVSDMSGPAIYFMPDATNPSTGADNLTASPTITSATTSTVAGTGIAGATVELYKADRDAGASGLPVAYLGSTTVAGDGSWTLATSSAVGDRVTALQYLANNNTSSLALNVTVAYDQPPTPPTAGFSYSQAPGTTDIQFSDTSAGTPTRWNWTFGDGLTSTQQNPGHTYSTSGTYTVTLTASNSGGQSSISTAITVTQPGGDIVVASDSFSRVVSSGWGAADTGGAYTLSNPGNFAANGNTGTITVPVANASRSAILNSVAQRNQDIKVRVAIDKLPVGGKTVVYLASRVIGNNEYRARLIFNPDGTLAINASALINGSESSLGSPVVVSGLTYTAGSFVWVRAQLSGASPTTIRVKTWADGQSEPAGWQFTTTNSQSPLQAAGAAGLRAYVDSSVSNVPITITIDDYAVTSTSSATTVVSDTFSRTKSSSWGNADLGGLYSLVGSASSFNVDGTAGTIDLPAAGATRSALLTGLSAMNVDIRFQLTLSALPSAGYVMVYAVARGNGNNEYRPRVMIKADGSVAVGASNVINGSESSLAPAVVVPGLTAVPGSAIWVHAQVSGANPTTISISAWAGGQGEPSSFQFTTTGTNSAVQGAGTLGLRTYLDVAASNAPIRVRFDDYSVTTTQ